MGDGQAENEKKEEGLQKHTLFLALTRPPMMPMLGVPIGPAFVLIIGFGEAYVLTGFNWRVAPFSILAWVISRFIVAKDHNAFNVLFLWIKTWGRSSRNARFWKGSSVSPASMQPAKKAKDIPFSV